MEYPHRVAALLLFHVERSRVLVQPKMERRRSPLVSIPPLGRDFQGIQSLRVADVLRNLRSFAIRSDYRLEEKSSTYAGSGSFGERILFRLVQELLSSLLSGAR